MAFSVCAFSVLTSGLQCSVVLLEFAIELLLFQLLAPIGGPHSVASCVEPLSFLPKSDEHWLSVLLASCVLFLLSWLAGL